MIAELRQPSHEQMFHGLRQIFADDLSRSASFRSACNTVTRKLLNKNNFFSPALGTFVAQ
jgi:hypothetical protein